MITGTTARTQDRGPRRSHHALAAALMLSSGAFLGGTQAQADSIQLSNGDRLTGTVIHLSGESLTLETSYAGRLVIRRSEVASIQTDGEVKVLLDGDAELQRARLGGGAPGLVAVEPVPGAVTEEVPLARIAYINPKPVESGIGVEYKGRVMLSSAYTRGNASNSRNYGEAVFDARAMRHAYNLGFKGTRAEDDGKEIESNALLSGNYDRFIDSDRFFLYGRGSLEQDRFRAIDLRSTVGAGVGLRVIDTENTRLSIRGGLDFVSLDRTVGMNERDPALGWGVRFSYWLLARRAELFHEQTGFWNLEDTAQVTLRSGTGVRVPITGGLSASAQVNVTWDKEPAPGSKSTDSTVLLGLGYAW